MPREKMMSKKEARRKGEIAAIRRAELIYTDTPYERLATTLENYRRPSAWRNDHALDREIQLSKIPSALINDFKVGYTNIGSSEIKRYISEAKKDGLLKDI